MPYTVSVHAYTSDATPTMERSKIIFTVSQSISVIPKASTPPSPGGKQYPHHGHGPHQNLVFLSALFPSDWESWNHHGAWPSRPSCPHGEKDAGQTIAAFKQQAQKLDGRWRERR